MTDQMPALKFEDDAQEKMCHTILGALEPHELEGAAMTSYIYACRKEESEKNKNDNNGEDPAQEGGDIILKEMQTHAALAMIRRHLVAHKGDREKALESVKETCEFRKMNCINQIRSIDLTQEYHNNEFMRTIKDAILQEALPKPKLMIRGNDKDGRATMIKMQYSGLSDQPDLFNWENLYWMERAIACTEKNGCEKINIVLDYSEYSRPGRKKPPTPVLKRIIQIMQQHYPERLHLVVAADAPLLMRSVWNLIWFFIDADTRQKIFFVYGDKAKVKKVSKHYNVEQVMPFLLPNGKLGPIEEAGVRRVLFEQKLDQDYDGK